MNLDLNEKKVLITASVSGIGKATGMAFLEEGAKVMFNGRNRNRLDALTNELSEKYGSDKVFAVCGDVTEPDTIAEIKSEVQSKWGGLDILIPCSGTGKALSDDRLDGQEWDYMMRNNIYPSVNLIREMLPLMKAGSDPNIVLISSVVAVNKAAAPVAYAAAKGAILTLNAYMSDMYSDNGVRINAVVPGNIYFEGGRWEELEKNDYSGTREYIDLNVPMKRFGTPEEIGDTIVFLASNRSSFTNGAVITIDGGQNRSI